MLNAARKETIKGKGILIALLVKLFFYKASLCKSL